MNHTPGPWKIGPLSGNNDTGIRADGHGYVCFLNRKWANPEASLAQEANARLIAAAPELLEALEELTSAEADTIEEFEAKQIDRLESAMTKARAVIAKAKGEPAE